jgi:hypothetical protein
LTPEVRLTVLDYSPFDNNLRVLVEGQDTPIVLGEILTRQVFVELSE